MEILCVVGALAIGVAIAFFYLLNTARKKTAPAGGKKEFTPVYVSIADKPASIMQGMDKFVAEVQKTESAGDRWRWIPMTIFFAGVGLMAVDGLLFLIGFRSFVFSVGGLLLWVAAVVLARSLRKSDSHDFSPRYYGVKEILRTLRDDLRPNATFLGHLDLTGALLSTKVAREANDTQNRTTQYFRDEWLSLKAKLYDGNVLRLSALQRSKQRKSYWKRSSISGKMKLKPSKFKGSEQQLKVRIVVNPEAYKIVPNAGFKPGLNIGKFTVSELDTQGGMINFAASSPFEEVDTENILTVLHSAYSLLQRKAA
jgi:hypothetical protein